MLPIESLSKQDFFEIVENARYKIHNYHPEWTDENYHDPGITMLELLAWLFDMQRYYLDRVTDKNYRRFFDLLGFASPDSALAKTLLKLQPHETLYMPKGFSFKAGDVVFETERDVLIQNTEVKAIIREEDGHPTSLKHVLGNTVSVFPFGEEPKAGTCFYIGLTDPLVKDKAYELYFKIANATFYEGIGIEASKHQMKWSYLKNDLQWDDVDIVRDVTHGMIRSGHVRMKIEEEMGLKGLFSENQSLYWIKIDFLKKGVHPSPEIEDIILNTVAVVNRERLIDYKPFEMNKEKEYKMACDGLYHMSQVVLQKQTEYGSWIDLTEDVYSIDLIDDDSVLKMSFIQEVTGPYRLIFCKDTFMDIIGSGNGLPHQTIEFDLEKAVEESLHIQVGREMSDGTTEWDDYLPTKDFVSSNAEACHFVANRRDSSLHFGTHESGNAPYKGFGNIRLIRFYESHFSKGNVRKGEINKPILSDKRIGDISNSEPAIGGIEPTTVEELKKQIVDEHRMVTRAVTLKDYEILTDNLPSVEFHKVKAIANLTDQNQVSVVIIPKTGEATPQPEYSFLSKVRDYLEPTRIIGTSLEVIMPNYIWLDVYMKINVRDRRSFNIKKLEKKLLERFSINHDGHSIGDDVDETNFYQFLYGYEGVLQIEDLQIQRTGNVGATSFLIMRDCHIDLA